MVSIGAAFATSTEEKGQSPLPDYAWAAKTYKSHKTAPSTTHVA